jgi:hypothetical protein
MKALSLADVGRSDVFGAYADADHIAWNTPQQRDRREEP